MFPEQSLAKIDFGPACWDWPPPPSPLNPYDEQAQNHSSPFTSWGQFSGTQSYNSTNVNPPPQYQQLTSPSSNFVTTKTPFTSAQTLYQIFNSDGQANSQNKEGFSGRGTGTDSITHSMPHSSQSSDGSSVLFSANNISSLHKKRKHHLLSYSQFSFEDGTVSGTTSDRTYVYYRHDRDKDGLYRCLWVGCGTETHVETTQKSIYWTYLDTHIKPFKTFCGLSYITRRGRDSHDDEFHCESESIYLCAQTGCPRGIEGEGYHLCTDLRDHMDLEHHGQRAADLNRIKVLEHKLRVEQERTAALRNIIQGLARVWQEDKQESTIILEKYMREVVDYSVRTQNESGACAMKFQEQLIQAMATR